MKTLTLILILAASLTAAEPPKPELPAIPVEQKLAIREAQLQVVTISETLGRLTLQYRALEGKHKEAQEALERLLSGLRKPADCKECELTEGLTWIRPVKETAK